MFKIDGNSGKAVPPEIDFFTTPLTNVGIECSRVVEVSTSNSVNTVPYEFRINNSRNFLDLQRSRLLIRCSIRDLEGNRRDIDAENYGLINLGGQTIFRQIQMFIGGAQVYDSSILQPYRAYMQGVLGSSLDYKRTHLGLAGYYAEEDPSAAQDLQYLERCERADGGATIELVAPICADLFNQNRALLPYLDVKLIFYPASDAFRIEQRAGDPAGYQLVIEDLVFLSRQITCHDSTMLAIDSMLREHRLISYQLNSIQMRSFFISAGRLHAPEHKLFTAATPRRLICGFTSSENFNGSIRTNPFDFRDFNVGEIFLDMGSETLPLRSWNMNFAQNNCARAFLSLQDTLGFTKSGETNGLTFENFKNGYTFFGFDVSPNSQDSESRDLLKLGETSLRIRFNHPIPEGGIYCIVFAEFSSELGINAERQPIVDSII